MSADYLVLTIVAIVGIGGGLFLISEAERYRARHHGDGKRLPHANH